MYLCFFKYVYISEPADITLLDSDNDSQPISSSQASPVAPSQQMHLVSLGKI